jgi:preprotein translocase subunit SecE
VASKNGDGRSVDDEFPDDEPVDELEDAEDEDVDDLDDADEDFDDEDLDEDEDDLEDEAPVGRGRSVATSRASAKAASAKAGSVARTRTTGKARKDTDLRPGLIGRFINFVREVVAELQKVIWPTRKELLTYTTVVVVFVAIMMSFVAGLDYAFARGMFLVFGNNK